MNQRCYFHKTQPILHFCSLKQCTLPLCHQCLQIHQQQHQDKYTSPSIVPYHQAYQQVLNTLTNFIQNVQSNKQNYLKKLNQDKTQTIKAVEQYYAQFQNKIQEQSSSFSQIQQRLHKLQKGSIKTVIYYYSGDISLKQPQYPQFKQISSSIKKFIQDLKNPQKQEIQTFRHQFNNCLQNKVNHCLQNKAQDRTNIQYETKQRINSKKKLIFSNQKYQQSLHKNTNYPYLQNPKKEENPSFKISQRQNTNMQEQRSQVKSYFNDEKFRKQNSANRKQFQTNVPFFMQQQQNNNRVLRQTPIIPNIDYRGTRSKTLDKFPSIAELKIPKQNLYQPLIRDSQSKKMESINVDFKPGKWNKQKLNGQINQNNQRPNSIYSQFNVTEPITQNQSNRLFLQEEFPNRHPLKTTDLDTYTPLNNPIPPTQSRQRAFSYQPGLRTTVSYNNLQLGRKVQPILGDQLKKNVLSPQEIRRMLEKKIEERNKVLIQKKQHQLKINTDRTMTNNNSTLNLRRDSLTQIGLRNDNIQKERQAINDFDKKEVDFVNMNTNKLGSQQRSGLYNTRDSIINQIYRETRY